MLALPMARTLLTRACIDATEEGVRHAERHV
jgi:hypothetical protein